MVGKKKHRSRFGSSRSDTERAGQTEELMTSDVESNNNNNSMLNHHGEYDILHLGKHPVKDLHAQGHQIHARNHASSHHGHGHHHSTRINHVSEFGANIFHLNRQSHRASSFSKDSAATDTSVKQPLELVEQVRSFHQLRLRHKMHALQIRHFRRKELHSNNMLTKLLGEAVINKTGGLIGGSSSEGLNRRFSSDLKLSDSILFGSPDDEDMLGTKQPGVDAGV